MNVALNDTAEIVHYALFKLQRIYKAGYCYKKAGVIVMDIVLQNEIQHSFFDTIDTTERNSLMKIFDEINIGMGKDIVKFAVQGKSKMET